MSSSISQIPNPLLNVLNSLKARISELQRQYGSLSNYGRPYLTSKKEVAVLFYLNQKLNIGLNTIASFIGVDKTALYKLVQRILTQQKVAITTEGHKVEVIDANPEELISIVEQEILNVEAKQRIADPMKSTIIHEFWTKDVERQSNKARRTFYNEKEKLATIKVVKEIMEYLLQNGQVSNPDFWDKEILLKAIDELYKDPRVKRQKIKLLRRIPKFREFLQGYVGAERKHIVPKTSALFYEDYIRIKELYKQGQIDEPTMLIVWLHITTGAREGWGSEITTSNSLEDAKTSLIGLRWENLTVLGDTLIIRIYEHKSQKTWTADLRIIDEEMIPIFLKYRQPKGNIVVSITGLKKIDEFRNWYSKQLKLISRLLNKPFELTPHDMRRSHISILAELGVPMEVAVSGLMDFGVGWEDLTTAIIFYTRFSKYTKQRILEQAQKIKEQIAQTTK